MGGQSGCGASGLLLLLGGDCIVYGLARDGVQPERAGTDRGREG